MYMNFSLVPSKSFVEVDESDFAKYEKRNDPFILKSTNGWNIYINTLHSSLSIDKVAAEFKKSLNLYDKGGWRKHTVTKKFLQESLEPKDIPLIYDYENETEYLCSGITHAELSGVFNSSFHRLEISEGEMLIFLGNGDLMKMLSGSEGEGLDVLISNPSVPEVAVASSLSVGYGKDEMALASIASQMEGKRLDFIKPDAIAPASSNFVIEGEILKEQSKRMEKFRTPIGTVEKEIPYNIFKFKRLLFDRKAAFGIIQGEIEHQTLFNIAKKVNPEMKIIF